MTSIKFYFIIAVLALSFLRESEQCNVGFGNLGLGNVGIGNMGFGNKGVFNRGLRNIGVLNRRSMNSIGVAHFMRRRKIGVGPIALPNFLPTG